MGLGEIVTLIVTGLVIGALGRLIVPGRDPIGILGTILIGIGGSFLGAFIGRTLFGRPGGFLLAVLGAALIVWLLRRARFGGRRF